MLNEAFYASALKAVGGLPGRAVVTPYPELLPTPLPEGVRWFDRLPFDQVVPKVRAVVHHGGIGTLTRALMAGTPQLVLADGADRPDNAARLAKLGLAKWLPPGKWPEAGEHLRELLASGGAARSSGGPRPVGGHHENGGPRCLAPRPAASESPGPHGIPARSAPPSPQKGSR